MSKPKTSTRLSYGQEINLIINLANVVYIGFQIWLKYIEIGNIKIVYVNKVLKNFKSTKANI